MPGRLRPLRAGCRGCQEEPELTMPVRIIRTKQMPGSGLPGHAEGSSLDFPMLRHTRRGVGLIRSKLLSIFALFLLATVGAFACDACVCPGSAESSGPASQGCSCPEGCWCRIAPSSVASPEDKSARFDVGARSVRLDTALTGDFSFFASPVSWRSVARTPVFSDSLPLRPPALRAGSLCLRI